MQHFHFLQHYEDTLSVWAQSLNTAHHSCVLEQSHSILCYRSHPNLFLHLYCVCYNYQSYIIITTKSRYDIQCTLHNVIMQLVVYSYLKKAITHNIDSYTRSCRVFIYTLIIVIFSKLPFLQVMFQSSLCR